MRALFLIFISCYLLLAHDLWVEKQGNFYTLHYGHLGFSKEHKGKKRMVYDPENVKEAICLKGDKRVNLEPKAEYPLKIEAKCDQLYVLMDNGYFTKTPYGTESMPKNEVKMALKSWKSIESVKYIEKGYDKPLNDSLEIVLKRVPKVGEKARLLILYDKKPVESANVSYNGKVRGVSSKDGRINIKIRESGFQQISASIEKACKSAMCDKIIYTTTLNFEANE